MLLTYTTQAQVHCSDQINTVTTDWRVPAPLSTNQWNWTTNYFEAHVKNPNYRVLEIPSPFVSPTGSYDYSPNVARFRKVNDKTGTVTFDVYPEDGWELLAYDMGKPCVGCIDPGKNAVKNPFFMLYNKHTGIIRAFVMLTERATSLANGATMQLKFGDNGKSALLSHAYTIAPPVGNFEPKTVMTMPNYYINESEFWLYADFPVTFDPCTCAYPSQLVLEVKLASQSIVNLEGTITGTVKEVLADNADVGFASYGFDLKTLENIVSRGQTGYKAYEDAKNASTDVLEWLKKNKILNLSKKKRELVTTTCLPLNCKGITSVVQEVAEVATGLSTAGIISEAVGVIGGILGFVNDGGSAQGAPVAFAIDEKITLTGTIVLTGAVASKSIYTPGSSGSQTAVNQKAYYNNILGVVGLLKTPELKLEKYIPDAVPILPPGYYCPSGNCGGYSTAVPIMKPPAIIK